MPVCRECHGTGQREIKIELKTRCPDCDGTKLLPDGSDCKRCDKWGEIGSGKFQVELKLCTTCMGSGKVSEGSVSIWFLVRAVPTSLLLLGGGGAVIWASWVFLSNTLVTALLAIIVVAIWGGLMWHFIGQMPSLGEISVANWFLIRSIPTTLVALTIGGAISWTSWIYLNNAPATAILALSAVVVWSIFMYYFISHLPE